MPDVNDFFSFINKVDDVSEEDQQQAANYLASIDALDDLSRIIDSIAGHLPMEIKQKQEILETADFQLRALFRQDHPRNGREPRQLLGKCKRQ